MYLEKIQEKLAPLYDLTRKGVEFKWTEVHQKAFDTVKEMLKEPPILVMPNTTGHFTMARDTSIIVTGCGLYQEQNEINRLVAFNSKRLPEAA